MAKTTVIIEIEHPDEMLETLVKTVVAEHPEMGARPPATNTQLTHNGFVSAMLERISEHACEGGEPFLCPGGRYRFETMDEVGGEVFDLAATVTVTDIASH